MLLKLLSLIKSNKLLSIVIAVSLISPAVFNNTIVKDEYYELSVFSKIAEAIETFLLSGRTKNTKVNPSENEIVVCGRCHSSVVQKREQLNVHVPFAKGRCSDCHFPHDPTNNESKLVVERKELCSTCHNFLQMKDKPYQHVPFAEGMCMDCHDPHASDYTKQLVLPPQVLCRTCHNFDKGNHFENKHPPFLVGDCVACHNPHASDHPNNTRKPLAELCFTCHREIAQQLENARVLHSPFAATMCTACHNPHQTNTRKLTKQAIPDLCFKCHNSRRLMGGFSHPMYSVTSPIDGSIVTCISCHNPHGNENEFMWRRPQQFLCLGCHEEKADRPLPEDKLIERRYSQ